MEPFLRGQRIYGYVDGTLTCPPSHISLPNCEFFLNPAHDVWIQQDQLIMSFLISSLSEETIPLAVGKQSSRAIWVALKTALANPSFSSHLCLQDKLINLKQNNLPITDYLQQAKGKQPPHDVFLIYILKGLCHEYRDLKMNIFSRSSTVTFEELHNYLLTHEYVNPDLHTPVEPSSSGILPTPPPTAQFASRDQGHFRGRGRSSQGRFARGSGRHSSNDRRPCPHRSNAPQANYAAPAYQSNSYTPSFVSSYAPWVPDTGASHHVSPNLATFHQPEVYNGADRLQVANGQQLNIGHTGNIYLPSTTRPLLLKNTLHLPNSTKSLLSVQQFYKDNATYFAFHPSYFLIRTRLPIALYYPEGVGMASTVFHPVKKRLRLSCCPHLILVVCRQLSGIIG
ncbi:hypothetical protein LIER_37777 [Lithospermum erythrorhizon]|uniref:Retrovirus-related Pol polyprotein from transposon TNT 1-94-like beta-barrel domain-containing protein n=1 Tax=Lithospermum erythrorhizon TaxID=34254 RepID=A0AAV3PSS8_LITER